MRLGFPVKILGHPGLRPYDSRRWQNSPHLSVSLAYLRDIILYLERKKIRFYRLAPELAPYIAHNDFPSFHRQIEECFKELAEVGKMALERGIRLSFHPPYVNLTSPQQEVVEHSLRKVNALARILEAMGLGPEAVVVIHAGGAYGDKPSALDRLCKVLEKLPQWVRSRLALENDDALFSVRDILWVHNRTDIPLVFDHLHFLNNRDELEEREALSLCLGTWPAGVTPKVHFSSPRTAMKLVEEAGKRRAYPPHPSEHADFVDPFEFIAFCRTALMTSQRDFDIMLEAKAKDLALLELRENVRKFAADLEVE